MELHEIYNGNASVSGQRNRKLTMETGQHRRRSTMLEQDNPRRRSSLLDVRRSSWMDLVEGSEIRPQRHSLKDIREADMREYSARFDFVVVFPMEKDDTGKWKQTDVTKHVIFEMLDAGLDIFTYYSVKQDELHCLVRAPV